MATKHPDSSGSVVIRPWAGEPEKLLDSRQEAEPAVFIVFSTHAHPTAHEVPSAIFGV
jgi:hypothetical protein